MKLYVCWGTFPSPRPGGHPCGNAYHALKDAGHEFEVIKSYGLGPLPDFLNNTRQDGEDFLGVAAKIPVRTEIQVFPLTQANEALQALKHDRVRGAAVLKVA